MSYLTVGDLRKALEGVDDSTLVVLQRDPEGNGYAPLGLVDTSDLVFDDGNNAKRYPHAGWSEARYRYLTPDLIEQGLTEDDLGDPADPACIVLMPEY